MGSLHRLLSFTCLLVLLASFSACSSTGPKEGDEKPLSLARGLADSYYSRAKKILVMDPINHAKHGGKSLEKKALRVIEDWVSLNGGFHFFPQGDLETDKTLVSEEQEFIVDAILETASDHGISAVLLPEIEAIELKDEGEDTGFFRDRTRTTEARVRIRVFDVKTSEPILTRKRTAGHTEASTTLLGGTKEPEYNSLHGQKAVEKALGEILALLPKYAKRIDWSGQIARVASPRFYIDSGRVTGLKIGQILKVYGKADRVPNAVDGKDLGHAKGRFKGTLKISSYVGEDAAIARVHSGGGFEELDHVELYLPRAK